MPRKGVLRTLANYVVNFEPDGADHGLESTPGLAFAVCYVAAHVGRIKAIEEHRDGQTQSDNQAQAGLRPNVRG